LKNIQEKILVALSGGVDSAVTVLELQKQGFEVIAVHFVMLSSAGASLADAKNIANQLGIELKEIDISVDFQAKILDNFIEEYRQGRTPNPCTLCNKEIKFKHLLRVADELGINFVATGHYARISKKDDILYISKAKDEKKDQSYFLYRLNQAEIARIVFPLGEFEKTKVIEIAKNAGIKIPSSESQDVCFMKNEGKLKDFLAMKIVEIPGNIVTEEGEIVGTHLGVAFCTIGQRRGLNISGGPFYVVLRDIENNMITVTRKKESEKLNPGKVIFKDVNWVGGIPDEKSEYFIKTRYLVKESRAKIRRIDKQKDYYEAQLIDFQWAVAPGQSLVVFEGDMVRGGGIII
jgi:tRNA-uridine 2-sulfurtransferase